MRLKKIYDFLQRLFKPERYKLTPKGISLQKYINDKYNGSDIYIEEYEKIINSWTESDMKIFCAIFGMK